MPELPEVQTTVNDLSNFQPPIIGAAFVDVWTDAKKIIKKPKNFKDFKKQIIGKKIKKFHRRGKNILIDLSDNKTLLIHQKMTGHLLYGNWRLLKNNWEPTTKGFLNDKINKYIHLVFWLSKAKMLALSDLRKFAKIELWDKDKLKKELESSLGPEPLDKNFSPKKFKQLLMNKNRAIKKVLMDQKVIAGIGNIYSDEILWQAKVNPFKQAKKLKDKEIKRIYQAIKKVLKQAIELRGTSVSDYRDLAGKKGLFDQVLRAYQKEGQKCPRCGQKIERQKIGGRAVHFCPKCQK